MPAQLILQQGKKPPFPYVLLDTNYSNKPFQLLSEYNYYGFTLQPCFNIPYTQPLIAIVIYLGAYNYSLLTNLICNTNTNTSSTNTQCNGQTRVTMEAPLMDLYGDNLEPINNFYGITANVPLKAFVYNNAIINDFVANSSVCVHINASTGGPVQTATGQTVYYVPLIITRLLVVML